MVGKDRHHFKHQLPFLEQLQTLDHQVPQYPFRILLFMDQVAHAPELRVLGVLAIQHMCCFTRIPKRNPADDCPYPVEFIRLGQHIVSVRVRIG